MLEEVGIEPLQRHQTPRSLKRGQDTATSIMSLSILSLSSTHNHTIMVDPNNRHITSSHTQANQAIPLPIEEAININNMGVITISIIRLTRATINHTRSIIDQEERLTTGEGEEVNRQSNSPYISKHLHSKFFHLNSILERVLLSTLNSLQQVLIQCIRDSSRL